MIASLQGRPSQIDEESLVISVHGVGYEVHCSRNTMDELAGHDFVELFIHTHVREDALQLFGFATSIEKRLFLSLVKVNGIGPKMALTILSASSVDKIVKMIEEGDAKGLAKLPRIGKKTAEQIILSLKGQLVSATEFTAVRRFAARDEIVSALVHLGFRVVDVEKVVDQMDSRIDVQSGVREGLAALTN